LTEPGYLGVAEAIAALREELAVARDSAVGEDVQFAVGSVEVELTMVAKRQGGGKFGAQFGVVTLGLDGSLAREQTHRLKISLTPKDAVTGEPVDVDAAVQSIPRR
jgi:hypothetical protein